RNDEKFKEFIAAKDAAKAAAEAALYRSWKDITGKRTIEAKFLEIKNSQVRLERKYVHKVVVLALAQLSKDDQAWVREESKKRWEEGKQERANARKVKRR